MEGDPENLVGRTLAGRYRVVRSIGAGGMGAVFEAEQLDLGRRVALKVLFDEDPRSIECFRQEAKATARLRSPHVVSVTELVESPEGAPFLVMELLDGEPLSTLLHRRRRRPSPLPTETGGVTCAHDLRSYNGNDRKTGDACSGFRRPADTASVRATGTLSCWLCYAPTPRGAGTSAVHGAPCKDVEESGRMPDGRWECLVRRR